MHFLSNVIEWNCLLVHLKFCGNMLTQTKYISAILYTVLTSKDYMDSDMLKHIQLQSSDGETVMLLYRVNWEYVGHCLVLVSVIIIYDMLRKVGWITFYMLSLLLLIVDTEEEESLLCWLWPSNRWRRCYTECSITYLAWPSLGCSARTWFMCQTLCQRVGNLWRWWYLSFSIQCCCTTSSKKEVP